MRISTVSWWHLYKEKKTVMTNHTLLKWTILVVNTPIPPEDYPLETEHESFYNKGYRQLKSFHVGELLLYTIIDHKISLNTIKLSNFSIAVDFKYTFTLHIIAKKE